MTTLKNPLQFSTRNDETCKAYAFSKTHTYSIVSVMQYIEHHKTLRLSSSDGSGEYKYRSSQQIFTDC